MKRITALSLSFALLTAIGCSSSNTSTSATSSTNKSGTAMKLSVTSPGSQTITQDRTDELTVKIDRDNFSGPIAVELKNLPKGVTVDTKDLMVPADKNSLIVTLKAAPDAPAAVDHAVGVTAKSKEQTTVPEVSTEFKLTVKAK